MKTTSIALAALSLATSTSAQAIQSYTTGAGGLSMQYAQIANGSNTDLRLRLAAPTTPGWGAVAIGNEMAGSLFFVMYPSADMKSTTVSLRTTKGNVMPTPVTDYDHVVMNSTIANDMMMADVICYSCGSWPSLNTASNSQHFIHAVGPGSAVSSDEQGATIKQHQIPSGYGFFNIDTGASQFPASDISGTSFFPTTAAATAPSTASSAPASDASAAMAEEMAHELYVYELVHIHAAMFCIVWLILAPAALWALRFGSVRIHYIIQLVNFFMIIPAFAVAVYMSSFTYPEFDTYHQKIGITVFVLAIVQVLFGGVQHFFFKRHTKRSSLADTKVNGGSDSDVGVEKNGQNGLAREESPKKPGVLSVAAHLHMWFGRAVMILGGINAPIGFWLISTSTPSYLKYAYATGFAGLVTVLGSIIGVGIVGTLQRRKARKTA